jgi:ribosomal RNA-processing protein 17
VTIESVDISRAGFSKPGGEDEDAAKEDTAKAEAVKAKDEPKRVDANGKRIWTKERPRTEWPKKKKKKFRYENKADRKVTRFKEGAKKRKMKESRTKE